MTTAFDSFRMDETYEPPVVEASAPPLEIVEHLNAKDQEAKWISGHPMHMVKYRTRGFSPVLWEDLPKEIQRAVRPMIESPERNHGELRLGDAILVWRPRGAGEYWEKAEALRAHRMMHQTGLGDEQTIASEINDRARSQVGKSVVHVEETDWSKTPPSAHVMGGTTAASQSEFSAEMRDALKRRREEIPD